MTWRISDIMDAIARKPRGKQRRKNAALVRDALRRRGLSAHRAISEYYHEITLAFGYADTVSFADKHGIDTLAEGWGPYDAKLADLLVEEARRRKIPEEAP
jgi:hypothetical protein